MKIGAKRMRYPSGDPENGPAYMQQWTGQDWICFVHRPTKDEDGYICCKNCGIYICDMDGKRRT